MAQGEATSYGLDNLSRLPDELLLLIVSLLPMKDAIRTSALSTRWRYLYMSRSNLDFYSLGSNTTCVDVISSVEQVFYYRGRRPINRFRICWSDRGYFDQMHFYRLIKCMMWHGIQEIDIDIPDNLLIPGSLFTCKTLVVLRLKLTWDSDLDLELPADVFLPSLKVLLLHDVISFPDGDDACERLFSNCPVLEEFDYHFQERDCKLIVCHPTLKRLAIRDQGFMNDFENYEIVINAPSVVYLEYSLVALDCHVVIDDIRSLIEADIKFEYEAQVALFTLSASNLIRGVSNIHKLSISGRTLESFEEVSIPMPMFHNLTHLTISRSNYMGLRAMLRFLTYCESLETLDLKGLPEHFNLDDSQIQERSGASLWLRLKTITITTFSGNANEMNVIKYLVQNARVLDFLKIGTSDIQRERRLEICELLLAFPRASDTCSIVLVDE